MLLRSRKKFDKPHLVFDDPREAEKKIFSVTPIVKPIAYTIDNLPGWCNREYKKEFDLFNPYTVICTCGEYKEQSKEYESRDYRRVCKHLYYLYRYRLKDEVPALTMMLMEQYHRYGAEELIKAEYGEAIFYYGFDRTGEWINIYCNESMWIRFSYNIKQKRWSDKIAPKNEEIYVGLLDKYFKINV